MRTPAFLAGDRPLPPPDRIPERRIAFAVLTGPSAMTAMFLINLMLIRPRCDTVATIARYAVTGGTMILSAAALLVAWRCWLATRDAVEPGTGGVAGRNRFLSISGVVLSAATFTLALWLLITLLVLDPCIRP